MASHPDKAQRIVPLSDLPMPCIGAPSCSYYHEDLGMGLHVAYFAWDRKQRREWVAHVTFECLGFMIEPSNDEALGGHPLAVSGLEPYSPQEVLNSTWTSELKRRNQVVFPDATPDHRWSVRHVVIPFKEQVLQVAAARWRSMHGAINPRHTITQYLAQLGSSGETVLE